MKISSLITSYGPLNALDSFKEVSDPLWSCTRWYKSYTYLRGEKGYI